MGDDFKIYEVNEGSNKSILTHSKNGKVRNLIYASLKIWNMKLQLLKQEIFQWNIVEFFLKVYFENEFRDMQVEFREVIFQSAPHFNCTILRREIKIKVQNMKLIFKLEIDTSLCTIDFA